MTKHSHQRDAIYNELCSRKDHPTAEDIYFALKQSIPSLSLATVYRNLDMLYQDGKAIKIPANGTNRFDGDVSNHPHFICTGCGSVIDLIPTGSIDLSDRFPDFEGSIKSQSTTFTGLCPTCAHSNVN